VRTPDRTPEEWHALLLKGDGFGLVPYGVAEKLFEQGKIVHLPSKNRRVALTGHVYVKAK
jgi:hypothetical protein